MIIKFQLVICKQQILDSTKLERYADDNSKLGENGKKLRSLRAISPFPTLVSKDLDFRHVKTRACLGKG